jgi:hypothetical protein
MPWLVKCTPYDPAIPGERSVYLSDTGFTSTPSDSPADTYWEKRLDVPLEVRSSLFEGSAIGGRTEITYGAVTIANNDGVFDVFGTYDWGGRRIEIYWTQVSRPVFNDFALIFSGTLERCILGDVISFDIRDTQVLLDQPFQIATFAGTGGVEGPTELKGRRKPRLLGYARQFEPILINAALLIYSYGSTQSGGVISASDGGLALTAGTNHADYATLAAATVAPGAYHTCNALSLVRLGASLGSILTLEADGVQVGGTVLRKFADIMQYVADTDTTLSASDFATGTVTAANTAMPQSLGYWYDGTSDPTIRNVLDFMAQSVLAYYSIDISGKIVIGRFESPTGAASYEFTSRDLFSIEPTPADRRLKRQVFNFNRRHRPLTTSESVASLSDTVREALAREWEQIEYLDSAVATSALLATDETLDTAFVSSAEATTEATRRVNLFGPIRQTFRISVPLVAGVRVGQIVNITYNRYNLNAGKKFVILLADPDSTEETIEMDIWG